MILIMILFRDFFWISWVGVVTQALRLISIMELSPFHHGENGQNIISRVVVVVGVVVVGTWLSKV